MSLHCHTFLGGVHVQYMWAYLLSTCHSSHTITPSSGVRIAVGIPDIYYHVCDKSWNKYQDESIGYTPNLVSFPSLLSILAAISHVNLALSSLLRFPTCSVVDKDNRTAAAAEFSAFLSLLWNSITISVPLAWSCLAGLNPALLSTIPITIHANAM